VIGLVIAAQLGALAEDDRVRIVIVRDKGAESCPSDDELLSGVRERIGSEPFRDNDDREGREIRIGIARDGSSLIARLALFSPNGTRLGIRVLHGDLDCASLGVDLVLAAAIAIDPLLLVRARPTKSTAKPATAERADTAIAPAPATGASSSTDELAHDLPAATPVVKTSVFGLPEPAGISAFAAVGYASGVVPSGAATFHAGAQFDYGILQLDAGLLWDIPASALVGPNKFDTTLVAFDGAACLVGNVQGNIVLRGCAKSEAGALSVSPEESPTFADAEQVTAPWLAIGIRGGAEVPVLPEAAIVASADVVSPLVRARFVDDVSGQLFFEPQLIEWDVVVGARIQIR
jgi:hypothetical protein